MTKEVTGSVFNRKTVCPNVSECPSFTASLRGEQIRNEGILKSYKFPEKEQRDRRWFCLCVYGKGILQIVSQERLDKSVGNER